MKNGIIFESTDDLAEIEEDFDFGFTPLPDGSFSVTAFEADGERLEFPASFRDKPVTRIESYYEGVQGRVWVTEVVIPEGIRVIGYQGLSFFCSLENISLPEGLLKLEDFAFDGCESLSEIDMPSSLKAIFKHAFYNCTSLSRVGLNEGLLGIGDGAFWCCESLKELHIPSSVDMIGSNPFTGCTSLERLTVAEGNEHFMAKDGCLYSRDGRILYAYPAARDGEGFRIPDGVREIGKNAFSSLKTLTELYIPESVEVICEEAFFFCPTLRRVVMPKDMAYLHKDAFYACDNLEIEVY